VFEKKLIHITNGNLQNPDPRKHEKVRKSTNISNCRKIRSKLLAKQNI
jgi:hypothetical protein